MWFIILSPLLFLAVHIFIYWAETIYPIEIPVWIPWVLLATSAILAWRFHRYRTLTLIALVLGWWFLVTQLSSINPELKMFWLRWAPPIILIPLMWLPESKLVSVRSILLFVLVFISAGWAMFGTAPQLPLASITLLNLDVTTLGLYLVLWEIGRAHV